MNRVSVVKTGKDLLIAVRVSFGNCCNKSGLPFDESIVGCPPYPFALRKMAEKYGK